MNVLLWLKRDLRLQDHPALTHAAGLGAVLAGCGSVGYLSQSVAGSEDAAACAARGGKMLPQGRMQSVRCVITFADAGQRCTDGDDCQGDCRVEDVANPPPASSGRMAAGT